MARYKLLRTGYIFDNQDGKTIPNVLSNFDYLNYVAWLNEGNLPDPEDIVVEPPNWTGLVVELSRRPGARAAFRAAGAAVLFSFMGALAARDEADLLAVLIEVRNSVAPANQANFTARGNEILEELNFTIRLS